MGPYSLPQYLTSVSELLGEARSWSIFGPSFIKEAENVVNVDGYWNKGSEKMPMEDYILGDKGRVQVFKYGCNV